MAAKDVKFSTEARDKMLRGVDIVVLPAGPSSAALNSLTI